MNVEIRLFATFRQAAGERTLERTYGDGATVRDVLVDLEASFPDLAGSFLADGDLRSSTTVLRNGRNVTHEAGIDTELDDGDTVAVTPPVSGG